MKTYLVGGCVRDKLLGLPVQDRDYMVVGATVADMLALGYTQVGADFPVFLHPETHDEYALARTERKSGTGYHGFLVGTENVTLEEDLARRDLTINALAEDEDGTVIDPHGGLKDLREQVFRHVSPAFAEDPVRVLRVLRFHARMGSQWRIAPETQALMRDMVSRGELHHLTAERVWKEVSRGLMEAHPELMLRGLLDFGLWQLPCFTAYEGAPSHATTSVMAAANAGASLEARFCLAFANEDREPSMGAEIPRSVKLALQAYQRLRPQGAYGIVEWSAEATLEMLHVSGALRDGSTLEHVLQAFDARKMPLAAHLRQALEKVSAVDTKSITQAMKPGPEVGKAIWQARLEALQR